MLNLKNTLIFCVLLSLVGLGTAVAFHGDETVKQVFASKLPNVPGHTITAELVEYPPGGKSQIHHHAGSTLAYVLRGKIRSQNSATGPVRIYNAGESFFEPPGSDHLVSENASANQPASLLAIHIAADGAVITKPGNAR